MGGHRAGERASALAVVAIEQFTLNSFKWFLGSNSADAERVLAQFQSALSQADAQILDASADHPELRGMGATVTMAFHLGTQLCVVHVGDSRAYLYRDGELLQLTQDHTLMADMIRSGALRPEQVTGHRFRHVITNVVGGEQLGVSVEARALEVQAGDRLLLCSDGLTEMVTNDAIAATLDAEPTPELAAKQRTGAVRPTPALPSRWLQRSIRHYRPHSVFAKPWTGGTPRPAASTRGAQASREPCRSRRW